MGFLKDFKDDLSQAVNELLPEEELGTTFNDDEMVNTLDEEPENEEMLEDADTIADEEEEDILNDNVDEEFINDLFNDEFDGTEELEQAGDTLQADAADSVLEETDDAIILPIEEEENTTMGYDEKTAKDEVTVITKGTVIDGSITSDGSLEVMGVIRGDIDCLGKLSIIGEVTGNAIASEVFVDTKRLEGSINSEGSVKISQGTVVIGDITASSGVIAGAVKGEIDINGPIVVDSSAIIKGNINAKSVQINNGAVIDGFCSLSYSEVDIEGVFEK